MDVTVTTADGTSAVNGADHLHLCGRPDRDRGQPEHRARQRAAPAVTITGTNFTGATAVTFGGTAAASFTVERATSITATSPAQRRARWTSR